MKFHLCGSKIPDNWSFNWMVGRGVKSIYLRGRDGSLNSDLCLQTCVIWDKLCNTSRLRLLCRIGNDKTFVVVKIEIRLHVLVTFSKVLSASSVLSIVCLSSPPKPQHTQSAVYFLHPASHYTVCHFKQDWNRLKNKAFSCAFFLLKSEISMHAESIF